MTTDKPLDPLLALSALSEKATAGPWFIGRMLNPANAPALIGDGDSVLAIFPGEWNHCTYNKQDAEFIAALVNWFRANTDDLRAANARGEWLPIESAPKDGTVVVMGYGEYRERDGFSPAFMRWYPHADGWFVNSMPFYPTHWQPLPAPPGSEAKLLARLIEAAESAAEAMCKDKLYVQTYARLRAALAALTTTPESN